MSSDGDGPALRIWALLGARAGDNEQVIALAEALGRPFDVKQLHYNTLRRLGPRLLGQSLVSLTKASRAIILAGPPPDLTISIGHRSVPVVQALRRRSAGGTRSVHLGFPRLSPDKFDLVITTPQYPVSDGSNVLRISYALTRRPAAVSADNRVLDALPAPRRLLIVGGPNLYWRIDRSALDRTLGAIIADAERNGGSVLVTTSPRTPPSIRNVIAEMLRKAPVPNLLAEPRRPPAYASLLVAADTIHVTADSVAMVSDAVRTGKPMALVPVAPTWLGTAAMALTDLLRPSHRAFPQDLRFFWRELATIGVTAQLTRPGVTVDPIRVALDRIEPIISLSGTATQTP